MCSKDKTDLCEEIVARREKRLRTSADYYARNNPIASDIDPDSCLRRQVLEIVAWQDKPLLDDPWLRGMFEQGTKLESQAKQWLEEDGFEVVHGQVPFQLTHRKTGQKCLSGKQDFAIIWEGVKTTIEHKLVPQHLYDSINSPDDFAEQYWQRKYPAQMQSYLIGSGDAKGIFLITDGRGQWKPIPTELDYEYAERIWSFAESIIEHVNDWQYYDSVRAETPLGKAGNLPLFTADQEQCEKCAFFGRTCNPELTNKGALALQSGELEALLAEREKVAAEGKAYKKFDEAVKKKLKALREDMGDDPRRLIVGAWTVDWGKRNFRQKTIEPEVVPAHHTWVPKIKWVGE